MLTGRLEVRCLAAAIQTGERILAPIRVLMERETKRSLRSCCGASALVC